MNEESRAGNGEDRFGGGDPVTAAAPLSEGEEAGGASGEDRRQLTSPGPPSSGHARGWILAAVVTLGAAAVVITGLRSRLDAGAALRAETAVLALPVVSVVHPARARPTEELVLPAEIQPYIDAPIYARTDGYLSHWYFDIGAHVRRGQLMAVIETPEVDQQLQQARSDLAQAEANRQLAQVTAARYQGLLKSQSVSQQDVDNAVGNLHAQQAAVAAAQDNVRRLEQLQSFERIYAPFDGVVTARNIDIGDLVNAGSGTGTRELFHVAAIRRLRVFASVPQIDSSSTRVGMRPYLTLPQFPRRRFGGQLVRTADAIDPATRTLRVEVDVENPGDVLLPGDYAEVHFALPSPAAAYLLPVTALIFRSQLTEVATVADGHHAELVPVTLGRDFGTQLEILAGVTEKDTVIVNPPDSLISGEAVRLATPADGSGR